MKTCLLVLIFLTAIIPYDLSAQNAKEDVIYLKDGSIYRGTIIEQIPHVSYKIEIAGGSVIMIKAEEVTKIAKEDKTATSYAYTKLSPQYEFHYRQRTWFIQGQVLTDFSAIGLRLVAGYKFNQFGYLGLGFGIESIQNDVHLKTTYSGGYLPLYVYYAGDILQNHVTPFYTVEAGYAFKPNKWGGNEVYNYSGNGPLGGAGGFMAGAGFGVRFYSRRRVHFDLSAHMDIKMASENFVKQIFTSSGSENYYYTSHGVLLLPGLRFGIGF